jgi:hypothetical protein
MADRELLEWLGITLADLLVYLATAAIAVMFFVSDPVVDVILAVLGVALTLAACPLGMKRNPDVSAFTNRVKLVTYPACFLLAVGAIVVHYIWFNK